MCERVRLGVVRLTFQGPLHGIASCPIPSQHPITAHQLQLQLRYVLFDIVPAMAVWPPLLTRTAVAVAVAAALPPHAPLTDLATYMLLAMSNLLQVCYRTEVFDSARPLSAGGTPNSIGMSSAARQRLCSIRCVSGMWALPRTSLPGLDCPVLCCAPPVLDGLDVQLFRPRRLNQRLSCGSPGRGLARDPSWWVLPTCSQREISPMGGNGVSLSRQIDSLPRSSLGSSCPGPGSMHRARHRQPLRIHP